MDAILKAADVISETRRAFAKIENLERNQVDLSNALAALDKRVRELEAGLREAKADIKLEAVKETQTIVNSVEGQLYQKIRSITVAVDRLSRPDSTGQIVLPANT